ncbi:hypothetical protein JOC75_001309 [Metabacillus crassostreae]|uniref:flagellar hook-length control protein FliK n=1 Tax=Metabacillus crassostreae TaxID=929098 RepID=UPI00195D255F|nr:flagellar hook-length control protein FliK [Metabacillus crassostreae]MBM7603339.1 hypothetical protein [Metabacillus crassostreae]
MNPINAFSNLLKHSFTLSQSENKLSLQENQIVQGRVVKLFPDQKALIQLGQSKLVAQLETSISINENYWFRVGGSMKQGISLKMLKQVEYDKNSKQEAAKDLVQLFHQKPSKENILLAKQLLKEELPITSQQFSAAIEVIKHTNKQAIPETIQAIQYAIKENFPISQGIIRALVQAQTDIPLTNQINSLIDSLQNVEGDSPNILHLTKSLINLKQYPVNNLIEKVINFIGNPELHRDLTNNEQRILAQLNIKLQDEQILNQVKGEIINLLDTSEQVTKQSVQNLNGYVNLPKLLSEIESDFINKIATEMTSSFTKDEVLTNFLSLEKQLGHVKLFSQVMNGSEDKNNIQSLKELLIIASKEVDLPVLKEQMEHLVQRLHGHSLLTQDHGPTQQIFTQIPLFFLDHQSDLTIQWEGKKQKDGSIDPSFCRIFFYLQLPKLADVMIDVQIQNRIMTISITNDHKDLKEFVLRKTDLLKQSLAEMNYQLTSVTVKPIELTVKSDKPLKLLTNNQGNLSYTGVDLWI